MRSVSWSCSQTKRALMVSRMPLSSRLTDPMSTSFGAGSPQSEAMARSSSISRLASIPPRLCIWRPLLLFAELLNIADDIACNLAGRGGTSSDSDPLFADEPFWLQVFQALNVHCRCSCNFFRDLHQPVRIIAARVAHHNGQVCSLGLCGHCLLALLSCHADVVVDDDLGPACADRLDEALGIPLAQCGLG